MGVEGERERERESGGGVITHLCFIYNEFLATYLWDEGLRGLGVRVRD